MNKRVCYLYLSRFDNDGDLLINRSFCSLLPEDTRVLTSRKNKALLDGLNMLNGKEIITPLNLLAFGELCWCLLLGKMVVTKSPGPTNFVGGTGFLLRIILGITNLLGNDVIFYSVDVKSRDKKILDSFTTRVYARRKIDGFLFSPDIAFINDYPTPSNVGSAETILVSLRSGEIAIKDELLKFISPLVNKKFVANVDADEHYMNEVFGVQAYRVDIGRYLSENSIKQVITNRLHVAIPSIVAGVDVIVVNNMIDPKTIDVLTSAGYQPSVIDPQNRFVQFTANAHTANQNRQKIRSQINAEFPSNIFA